MPTEENRFEQYYKTYTDAAEATDDEIHIYTFGYDEVLRMCRDFLVAEEGEEKAEQGYSFSDFEIRETDSAGYVSSLRIGQTICTGDQFRDALGLSSSAFFFQ